MAKKNQKKLIRSQDAGTAARPVFSEVQKALEEARTRGGRQKGAKGGTSTLSGGDVDAVADEAGAGAETVGGSVPTPDQDIVEVLGKAAGVTYQDDEELNPVEKIKKRDRKRWELNPSSSEDYQERSQRKAEQWTLCRPLRSGTTPCCETEYLSRTSQRTGPGATEGWCARRL